MAVYLCNYTDVTVRDDFIFFFTLGLAFIRQKSREWKGGGDHMLTECFTTV